MVKLVNVLFAAPSISQMVSCQLPDKALSIRYASRFVNLCAFALKQIAIVNVNMVIIIFFISVKKRICRFVGCLYGL